MNNTIAPGFEFGEFVLYPEHRVLTQLGVSVQINQKDFDILTHLLENHGRVVTQKEIIESVWGTGAQLAEGNVSNHIAKIRRLIGCDPLHPKFIKTVRAQQGYRFSGPVKVAAAPFVPDESQHPIIRNSGYGLTTHLFVPMYLGANAFRKLGGASRQTDWSEYKEISIETGRLCVHPSDYGVWHVQLKGDYKRLSDFAIARKLVYREILSGRHVINACTRELAGTSDAGDPLRPIIGRPGYVFSAAVLRSTTAKRKETIRNILRILSLPTSLESTGETASMNTPALENKLLSEGMNPRGLLEFGLPGADLGYASWDGVSYAKSPLGHQTLEDSIVEFEIALQALWWECKSIVDVILTDDTPISESVRSHSLAAKRQLARLRNVGPVESPSRRSMAEAVIETSRIEQIVSELLRLAERTEP